MTQASVTVIICTYDRCRELAVALESIAASEVPDLLTWEVLVVDNNSLDQTREVVDGFRRRYPGRFRYLFEPQPGKSHALNSGVREAKGKVLAFMDDDLTVERTWLQKLTLALQDTRWTGSAGRTMAGNAVSLPRWLGFREPYSLGGPLCALFDLGDEAFVLDRAPYGANMAFRKDVFEKYGGFRVDLGPSPNPDQVPRPNEDTEFGRRLMRAGERLLYVPDAIAYHPVPVGRIRKEYFLRWWFDYGRAMSRELANRPPILGVPRSYLSMLKHVFVRIPGRTLRWMLSVNPQRRFYRKCWVWEIAGEIAEIYQSSFSRQTAEAARQRAAG